jgi:hypothetical protein
MNRARLSDQVPNDQSIPILARWRDAHQSMRACLRCTHVLVIERTLLCRNQTVRLRHLERASPAWGQRVLSGDNPSVLVPASEARSTDGACGPSAACHSDGTLFAGSR